MEHTKTPWIIDADTIRGAEDGTICIGMIGNERNHLTFENWEANARRIVAAVNATAGIETFDLETLPINFEAMAQDRIRLQRVNQRLLDALKAMTGMVKMCGIQYIQYDQITGNIENMTDETPLIINVPAGKMVQLGDAMALQVNEGFDKSQLIDQLIEAHQQLLNNETPL